ncbi:hypothetical protein EVAR_29510_1 [Eumeta japonica]|uniref:Uncharacterized protein n=1 Tax=Eumeta variegata TaxID=151549 RepID=A0A4C1WID5_EUMVA|nr:hypothetical protein EVAR_29510_1 [Eumeta japonica]
MLSMCKERDPILRHPFVPPKHKYAASVNINDRIQIQSVLECLSVQLAMAVGGRRSVITAIETSLRPTAAKVDHADVSEFLWCNLRRDGSCAASQPRSYRLCTLAVVQLTSVCGDSPRARGSRTSDLLIAAIRRAARGAGCADETSRVGRRTTGLHRTTYKKYNYS